MLNKSERFKALQFLKFCSVVCPLPTQVDLASWNLNAPSLKKRCLFAVSFGCFILHSLYMNGTLIYAYFFRSEVQLHQLIIHAAVAEASIMCGFWCYVEYIKDPALFAAYVKATLKGNIGGGKGLMDIKDELKTTWTKRLREYSMQDMVAMGMPYMIPLAIPFVCSCYVYDSSMTLLLYASLPTGYQNWATFGLLLIEEARFLMICAFSATTTWQLQVISFDLMCTQLQLLMEKIQNNMQRPTTVYRTLRRLQLYVLMVNSVNSYLIYIAKLFCISVCIISGYAAIARFGDYPIFGVMYYFILFDGTCIYTLVYRKAFKIPELIQESASCALLSYRGDGTAAFRRQIRSIPRSGIRVGEFHHMERESTLIFMDYVVGNVVSMLVAFP